MVEILLRIFNLSVIQNTIRTSTPLILAALGGLLTMQADILNIGMDGMILIGAFFAVLGSYLFASSLMGVAFAVLSGIVIGLFFSFMVVKLKADEFIVGIAINIFAGGLTVFLLRSIFGVKGAFSSEQIIAIPRLHIPLLENIYFLDMIFNNHSVTVYISWLLVILVTIFLYKTPYGMWLRAAGEYPEALDTVGVSSQLMKHFSSVMCGIFTGLAGAHLSLGYLKLFSEGMSADRGFIALAAIIFGRSHPVKTFGAALLFGFFDAVGMRLQGVGVPSQFSKAIPYLFTVIALFIIAKRHLDKKGKEALETVK